jgi:DNA polymerase elongation subunit (family B)
MFDPIAALLTTAYARLRLYSVIEQYKEEVVYFDTDSVILHLPPGMSGPDVSDLLGELKDEVADTFGKKYPEAQITSFLSLGPKCYSYTYYSSFICI